MGILRSNTKIGDIFSVDIGNGNFKCFQLIAFDLAQLNSDVIRAFKTSYADTSMPNIEVIVNDEVEFYAHCVTKFGLKLKLWNKIGNSNNVGLLSNILFRSSSDSGSKVGEENIIISNKWYIWRINDKNHKYVGKLMGEYRNAEIGIVVNPFDIVDRIKTGKYNFFYPGFE